MFIHILPTKVAVFLSLLLVSSTPSAVVSAGWISTGSTSKISHPSRYHRVSIKHSSPLTIQPTATSIRGGGSSNEELKDCGGAVSGLFGNLRIPASLIAGASLGSAFALPLGEADGLRIGMVKRVYALLMMGSLASMLLVVLVSTLTMNDITIRPSRLSKSAGDYIDENYALEWLAAKTNFIWGNVAFVVGASLRGWIAIACPIIGKGVLGIMSSLTLVSISVLFQLEYNRTGRTPFESFSRAVKIVVNKMKVNSLFAVAAIMWASTVAYVFSKIPHIYHYLVG